MPRQFASAGKMGDFAMPGLRFDQLFSLTCLILLLVSPCAALADPIAARPNVEIGGPPPEADSKQKTEKPAGSDPKPPPPHRRQS
jgi:hypothetical protein